MNNFMIDIETIDTRVTAGILSIAVVAFEPGVSTGLRRMSRLGIDEARRHGTESRATLDWWQEQPPAVRNAQFYPSQSDKIGPILERLSEWLVLAAGDAEPVVWAWGVSFDIAILAHQMDRASIPTPWGRWNIVDARTICRYMGVKKDDLEFLGKPHNPMDDCVHQIRLLKLASDKRDAATLPKP